MSDIKMTEDLEVLRCGECGVMYAVTKGLLACRREDHATFFCPSGHRRHFPAPPTVDLAAKLTSDLAASAERVAAFTAWVTRAPHLAACNVRVDRPCDCGRTALVGDVAAPEVTSAN